MHSTSDPVLARHCVALPTAANGAATALLCVRWLVTPVHNTGAQQLIDHHNHPSLTSVEGLSPGRLQRLQAPCSSEALSFRPPEVDGLP